MRQKAFLSALILWLLCPVVSAKNVSMQEKTTLVLEDVEVNKLDTLFVYCLPPPSDLDARTKISVFRSGHPDWVRVQSGESTDGQWLRSDYRPSRDHWSSKVTVICTIESKLPQELTRETVRFFTLLADQPMKWDDVHESSSNFFLTTPVTDNNTESGDFVYELPWPADVTIEISKKTEAGYTAPFITLKDQWPDKGIKHTQWNRGNDFQKMEDGQYKGKVTCRQTDGDKRYRKRVDISLWFKRK